MDQTHIQKQYTRLSELPSDRYLIAERAITRILRTELASDTFAQVVDGRPLSHVYKDYYGESRRDFDENTRPSKEADDIVKGLRDSLELSDMEVETRLLEAFKELEPESKEFNVLLLELIAVVIHDLSVRIYKKYDGGIRKPRPERSPSPPIIVPSGLTIPPMPSIPNTDSVLLTELFHTHYQYAEQYPNGIADIVGYWVEYQLFGGVVLFDRGEDGKQTRSVFIHPVGKYRIFELSQEQIQRFAQLGSATKAEDVETRIIHPFKADKSASRVDPWDAFHHLNIYRDRYERQIPEEKPVSCVRRLEDYPDELEKWQSFVRKREMREDEESIEKEVESKRVKTWSSLEGKSEELESISNELKK